MTTNTEAQQASIRAVTGTEYSYNGDWHALFDLDGIPVGEWNGRLLAWINTQLVPDYADLPGAMQAFAEAQGAPNWNSMGTLTIGLGFFVLMETSGAVELEDETGFILLQ